MQEQPKNPLHGITLQTILEDLVARRGWADLATHVNVRCFSFDPSVKSSLKFLRKTDWARAQVETLYLNDQRELERNRERNRQRKSRREFRRGQEAAGETGATSVDPEEAGDDSSDEA